MHRIHLLLQAQAYLLESLLIRSLPDDLESVVIYLATPALRTCIAQKHDSPHAPVDIVQQETKILRRSFAGNMRNEEVPQAAMEFSISVLSLGTSLKEDAPFPESMCNSIIEPAIAGSLLVLELLCSASAGRDSLHDDIRWTKGLWWALYSAAGDASANPPRRPTTTSFAALSCLKCFVEDDQYCKRIIEQGLYLPLLLLAVPPANSTIKEDDLKSAILYSAADVLGSLIRVLNKVDQFSLAGQQGGNTVISRIIPHVLLKWLEEADGPEKFSSLGNTDVVQPTSIWTSKVRAELWLEICKRLKQHNLSYITGNSMAFEDELEWLQRFEYESLKDELIIGGLFVRGLCNGYIETFNLPEGHSYLDAIQDYLELHLDSMLDDENCDNQDGIQQEARETYLSVLTALRRCLKYAVMNSREDLIEHFKPQVLSRLVSAGLSFQDIQVEIAMIVKILSEHQSGRGMVLQSVIMTALAVQLWHAAGKQGSEQVLMGTLEAIVLLSENMPATLSATNYFATSGLLLPLLALFCQVDFPQLCSSKEEEVIKLVPIPLSSQLLAAQVIGQLLLAGSGIIRRTKLLKDLAKLKSFANGSDRRISTSDDSMEEATDMYELFDLIEPTPGKTKEEPLVIKTLLLLLPIELLSAIARDPSEACDMYNGHFQSPRLVWDEGTRLRVKTTIRKEAEYVQRLAENEGLTSIPSWYLKEQRPVFLRWVLIAIFNDERKSLYKDSKEQGYAREMYIGGFYIDQFLRNPEFDFGAAIEERFLHEVRKAIIVGASSTNESSIEKFDFDDKRRFILALLLLFKLRPYLLARHKNFDIFLPAYDFIGAAHNPEQRGLAQASILLLHCTATHSDVADCMCSEEFICTMSSLLDLKVPQSDVGFAGTDPRLCSLWLLLRLFRLSSKAVELALRFNVVPKLIKIIEMKDDCIEGIEDPSDVVSQKAAECLAVMSADKRAGQEVCKLLDKLMPKGLRDNKQWEVPLADIRDEMVDSKTLKHFLRHRYPSSWWISDLSDHRNGNGEKALDPMTVIE